MQMSHVRHRWGISAVSGAVILISIALVAGIVVALYLQGIVKNYTRFEKIDLVEARYEPWPRAECVAQGSNLRPLKLKIRNKGPSEVVVIDKVFVNGRPHPPEFVCWYGYNTYQGAWGTWCDLSENPVYLPADWWVEILLCDIPSNPIFHSGLTYHVTFTTTRGGKYTVVAYVP